MSLVVWLCVARCGAFRSRRLAGGRRLPPRRAAVAAAAALAELDVLDGVPLTHHRVHVASDVTLHVVEAGGGTASAVGGALPSPPTVCLLHG